MPKSRKKKRKSVNDQPTDSDSPRILVIRRGIVGYDVKQLAQNLRLVLSPNCATRLKEGSKQKLRDFTSVADLLGLTHLIVLSQSSNGTYLKIANFPRGPTLTFLVNRLSLISDISKHTNNPRSFDSSTHPPLLVLNGFSRTFKGKRESTDDTKDSSNLEDVIAGITDTFNTMIAPLDVTTTKIQNCKRVILFHRQKDDTFVLRHYSINLVDCNTSSQVKDLLTRKTMKNLIGESSDFDNIMSTHLSQDTKAGRDLNGDAEDDEIVELDNILTQSLIAKNKYGVELDPERAAEGTNRIAIRLVEVGPRLSLTLVKVQDDVFTGSVSYHKFVTKSPEELAEIKKNEPAIVNKRKLESERVMKLYEKYAKKKDSGASAEAPEKEKPNKKPKTAKKL